MSKPISWASSACAQPAEAQEALTELADKVHGQHTQAIVDGVRYEAHQLYVLSAMMAPDSAAVAIEKVAALEQHELAKAEVVLPTSCNRLFVHLPQRQTVPAWRALELYQECCAKSYAAALWLPFLKYASLTKVKVSLLLQHQPRHFTPEEAAAHYVSELHKSPALFTEVADCLPQYPSVEKLLGMTPQQCRLARLLKLPSLHEWLKLAYTLTAERALLPSGQVTLSEVTHSSSSCVKEAFQMCKTPADFLLYVTDVSTWQLEYLSPETMMECASRGFHAWGAPADVYRELGFKLLALCDRESKAAQRANEREAAVKRQLSAKAAAMEAVERKEAELALQLQQMAAEKASVAKELEQTEEAHARERERLLKMHQDQEAETLAMQKLQEEQRTETARLVAARREKEKQLKQLEEEQRQQVAEKEKILKEQEEKDQQLAKLLEEKHRLDLLGLSHSALRLAQEEAESRHSPLDFYDFIIDIQRLQDVYEGPGWPICFRDEESYRSFIDYVIGFCVSTIGDFNVGKSWLLSMLSSGHRFQSGDRVHTIGISVKQVNLRGKEAADQSCGKKAFFIDTQGLNSPVLTPMHEQGRQQKDGMAHHIALEKWLQEMQALEEFQRQVALFVANVFLFVVGQLSAKNQKDLQLLYKAIIAMKRRKKHLPTQRIFVIHNLRDWTHEQLMESRYMDNIQRHYGGQLERQTEIPGQFSYLHGKMGTADMDPVHVEHVFLTKAGAVNCQNEHVFDYLNKVLETCVLDKFNLSERLQGAMAEYLPSFLQVVNARRATPPTLAIEDRVVGDESEGPRDVHQLRKPGQKTAWIHVKKDQDLREKPQVMVRCRPLGNIISLASDDLSFNLSDVPCMIKTFKKKKELRWMRVLSIEVPGLVMSGFTCLVNARPADGACDQQPPPDLMLSNLKGDEEGVRVDLSAWLQANPVAMNHLAESGEEMPPDFDDLDEDAQAVALTKLYGKFNVSSGGTVSNLEQYTCRVLDKGTRALDNGAWRRRVNFQHCFSHQELKWDTSYSPYYCYQDGILSIGFVVVASEKPTESQVREYETARLEDPPFPSIPCDPPREEVATVEPLRLASAEVPTEVVPRTSERAPADGQSVASNDWVELPENPSNSSI